jgi:hypothetical protein
VGKPRGDLGVAIGLHLTGIHSESLRDAHRASAIQQQPLVWYRGVHYWDWLVNSVGVTMAEVFTFREEAGLPRPGPASVNGLIAHLQRPGIFFT